MTIRALGCLARLVPSLEKMRSFRPGGRWVDSPLYGLIIVLALCSLFLHFWHAQSVSQVNAVADLVICLVSLFAPDFRCRRCTVFEACQCHPDASGGSHEVP